jgi:hypothetical protein
MDPFKVGPLVCGTRIFYLLRGEKGSATYGIYKDQDLGSIDIHKISMYGSDICEWNGNVKSHCDGRTVRRIETEAEIWETLLKAYNQF